MVEAASIRAGSALLDPGPSSRAGGASLAEALLAAGTSSWGAAGQRSAAAASSPGGGGSGSGDSSCRRATVTVRKTIGPKIRPPYPLSLTLKSHAAGQVQDMLRGLVAAAVALKPT